MRFRGTTDLGVVSHEVAVSACHDYDAEESDAEVSVHWQGKWLSAPATAAAA